MLRAFESDVYKVNINWSRPRLYDNALNSEIKEIDNIFFYKIIARYNGKYKLLYIGKAYRQYVTSRLLNLDHKGKRERLNEKYKRHDLLISFGAVNTNKKRNHRLIDEVESLLIYTHCDINTLINDKNKWSHNITRDYHIINSGFRRDGMVKEIGLGLFFKW